jgi:putative two-component system response regulator
MTRTAPDATILIVDDEPPNLALLERVLQDAGYRRVVGTTDPREALTLFTARRPDLVLLDLHMPVLDGFGVLRALEATQTEDSFLPVLVLTADVTVATKHRALQSGATDFLTKPFDVTEVVLRIGNLLATRRLHLEFVDRTQALATEVSQRTEDVAAAQLETAQRLTIAAETRDDETGEHIERVGILSAALARRLELPEPLVHEIGLAARLHDVGKIGVPDSVLLKPGPLTHEEFEVMRSHTVIGRGILAQSTSPVLRMAADVALAHHERWDGGGYPNGLAAEAIPLAARIVGVADAFDAMTNARRYRPARPVEAAVAEIERERARHFDPDVAAVLPSAIDLVTSARS